MADEDISPAVPPRLSIVVVSYETRDMTLDCLRSVAAETRTPCEVIVIDNASSDGSAAAIAAEFPDVVLMDESTNHGFARANNMAAARATGEYLLLLNPDTLVLDGALDRLLDFAEAHPEAKIWGGRTLWEDRTLNPTSCWRRMSLWNIFCRTAGLTGVFPNSDLFNAEAYGGWDRGEVRGVDIVTGCLFLMRRSDWQALGGFDDDFLMYGEEVDLCLRAQRDLGAKPMITPAATIVHYGGASQKVRADKMVRLLRAKTELIRRHVPAWQRPLALRLFHGWPLSRWGALKLLSATGRGALGDRASVWQEVWSRRAEWKRGFR